MSANDDAPCAGARLNGNMQLRRKGLEAHRAGSRVLKIHRAPAMGQVQGKEAVTEKREDSQERQRKERRGQSQSKRQPCQHSRGLVQRALQEGRDTLFGRLRVVNCPKLANEAACKGARQLARSKAKQDGSRVLEDFTWLTVRNHGSRQMFDGP